MGALFPGLTLPPPPSCKVSWSTAWFVADASIQSMPIVETLARVSSRLRLEGWVTPRGSSSLEASIAPVVDRPLASKPASDGASKGPVALLSPSRHSKAHRCGQVDEIIVPPLHRPQVIFSSCYLALPRACMGHPVKGVVLLWQPSSHRAPWFLNHVEGPPTTALTATPLPLTDLTMATRGRCGPWLLAPGNSGDVLPICRDPSKAR